MRHYLLGYDTADGLKRSAKAREYMQEREQDDLTPLCAMPDLGGLHNVHYNAEVVNNERIRLFYLQKSIDDTLHPPVKLPVESEPLTLERWQEMHTPPEQRKPVVKDYEFVEFPTRPEPASPECYQPRILKETPSFWQRFLRFIGF